MEAPKEDKGKGKGKDGKGGKGKGKSGPGEKPEGCKGVFVGSVSPDVEEDDLWEFFGESCCRMEFSYLRCVGDGLLLHGEFEMSGSSQCSADFVGEKGAAKSSAVLRVVAFLRFRLEGQKSPLFGNVDYKALAP